MHLGPIFKHLRLSKHISLRAAAGDSCSPSLLSRFENEQTDLTSQKLLDVLQNIHITLAEFSHYIYPQHTSAITHIRRLRDDNDIEGLSKLYAEERQLAAQEDQPYHAINSLIIKVYLYSYNQKEPLSSDELAFLHDWLFTLETWGEQEIELFAISSLFLAPQLYVTYTQELLKKVDLAKLYPQKRHTLLLNGLMLCVEREEYGYATFFKELIEQDFYLERDAYYRILYQWTCGAWQAKTTDKVAGITKMEQAIHILEMLNCHSSAHYYQEETSRVKRMVYSKS
ncbi:Rgg/GadR/MutR family transcriptional regulator [Streptococcus ovis]|uniref:Rgg/GadR/MutR family transcriptional regulator n=1 Tax=Streptococcus ovis TaxID=82806 RepID=UPI00037B3B22|nr:Rgg/GadR/MutR family transcriptional regulator [Streptococcus ovis]